MAFFGNFPLANRPPKPFFGRGGQGCPIISVYTGGFVLGWFEVFNYATDYVFKIVVLVGGGYLIYFMNYVFKAKIESYKAKIELLEASQPDKILERIKALKYLHEEAMKEREHEISELKAEMERILEQNLSKDETIKAQKQVIDDFNEGLIIFDIKHGKLINDSLQDIEGWAKRLELDDATWERYLSMLRDKNSIKKITLEDLMKYDWKTGKKDDNEYKE
jgi:hypothetical protein